MDDGWMDGDRGFKVIALFFPESRGFFLPFYVPLIQPLRWEGSCSVPRKQGTHTHTEILRGILEMLQDAKPLCELECVCSPAPWHRAIPPLPPTRTCVCVRVFLLTTVPVAAMNRAETPLAARLWQGGKGGSGGGRWGSWWGFKGFLHSWALFVTEHNLHRTSINPPRLKSSTLERIRWMWTGFLSLSVWWALLIYVHMYLHACQQC